VGNQFAITMTVISARYYADVIPAFAGMADQRVWNDEQLHGINL